MNPGRLFIDIRRRSLHALYFPAGSRRRFAPETLALPLEGGDLASDLDEAFSRLVRETPGEHSLCHLSLPGPWIAYRNMEVPFREHRKVRQILPFEMEPLLPGGMDDYRYAYHSLGWDTARQVHRIIGAAGRGAVLETVAAVARAHGLKINGIHAGGMALAACLAQEIAAAKPQAFLLLDRHHLEIFGLDAGGVQMVRSCALTDGAEPSVQSLARYAHHFKSSFNGRAPEEDPMPLWLLDRRTTGNHPAWLAGIQAHTAGIRWQPLNGQALNLVDIPAGDKKTLRGFEGAMAMAAARSRHLPQINFIEEKFNTVRSLQEHGPQLVRIGLLGLAAVAMLLVNLWADNLSLSRTVAAHEERQRAMLQAAFPEIRRIVDPRHQMHTRVEQSAREARPLTVLMESRPKIELLQGIVQRTPPSIDMALNRIMLGDDRVIIQGGAENFDDINRIKSNLEKWEAIRSVTISSANVEQGEQKVRFQLTIDTRPGSSGTEVTTAGPAGDEEATHSE